MGVGISASQVVGNSERFQEPGSLLQLRVLTFLPCRGTVVTTVLRMKKLNFREVIDLAKVTSVLNEGTRGYRVIKSGPHATTLLKMPATQSDRLGSSGERPLEEGTAELRPELRTCQAQAEPGWE